MTKPERRLGRGLASLIGDLTGAAETTAQAPHETVHGPRQIPVTAISPNPTQPRTHIDPDQLRELTDSILAAGVIQPIVVRPQGGHYELVAGERRWRAAQAAGLTSIPAVVRDVSDQQMLEYALIENIQREDLNPIDRAAGYAHCCHQFAMNPEELAHHLGEDRTTVVNYIRLLDLPQSVQDLVREGDLSMGHARSLLGLPTAEEIERVARQAAADGLSVRELEDLVRRAKSDPAQGSAKPKREPPPKRPLVQDLEGRFQEALQTRVTIVEGRKKNSGRVVIEYYSVDDFGRIAERLGVSLHEL
jgi:ParB family chromosome partitioning protein